MIVHGGRPSPFARKVMTFLEEKGIAYESKALVPIPKTPELFEKHPQGKIPVLEHEGRYIPDSSVICQYVERLHPEPALYPADPKELARALFLEEYSDTSVTSALGPIFFERFIKPNLMGAEADEERANQAWENDVPPVFDYLESQLTKGAETLLGSFSIADAALAGALGNLAFVGLEVDASRWPKLAAYAKALLARPSYQKAAGG